MCFMSGDSGRDTQNDVAKQQLALAASAEAERKKQQAAAEPFLSSLESTAPGELSPLAKSQYASDTRNIVDTYGNARRVGLKSLAQRGFGNAPTGMQASVINTNDRNQGADETKAYENALQQTYGQGLEAMKARLGLVSTYDPTKPASVASDAAYRQSQSGSTLGDVGKGVASGLAALGKG